MNQAYAAITQVQPGGSQYLRYLIDIRMPGYQFKELITNYDIGHIDGISQAQLIDIQNQIYKESGQQIFDAMTSDFNLFNQALANMPHFNYFDQHEVLFQDLTRRQIFTAGFRNFAMQLAQITFLRIPITPNLEFFLESIGPDYMSVVVHPKNIKR